ncbi:MAG: hypothetical protein AAGJ18_04070, partial [Bacteroidota bacterium]
LIASYEQLAERVTLFCEQNQGVNNKTACVFATTVEQLRENPSYELVQEIIERCKTEEAWTPLLIELLEIQQTINALRRQINQLQKQGEDPFLLKATANATFTIGGTNNLAQAGISPIVLQQQAAKGSIQGSIIDGTGKWIAERMREELSIAFFDNLEQWVGNRNIRLLFPNTLNALKTSENTDYSLMIRIFQTAFEKDLQSLPFQFFDFLQAELHLQDSIKLLEGRYYVAQSDYLKTKNHYQKISDLEDVSIDKTLLLEEKIELAIFQKDTASQIKYEEALEREEAIYEVYYKERNRLDDEVEKKQATVEGINRVRVQQNQLLHLLLFSMEGVKLLTDGKHPAGLLTALYQNGGPIAPNIPKLKPALLMLDAISQSLITVNQQENTVWIKPQKLAVLGQDAQLRDFYFGLVYQSMQQRLAKEKQAINVQISDLYQTKIAATEAGQDIEQYMELAEAASNYFVDDLADKFLLAMVQKRMTPQQQRNIPKIHLREFMELPTDAPHYARMLEVANATLTTFKTEVERTEAWQQFPLASYLKMDATIYEVQWELDAYLAKMLGIEEAEVPSLLSEKVDGLFNFAASNELLLVPNDAQAKQKIERAINQFIQENWESPEASGELRIFLRKHLNDYWYYSVLEKKYYELLNPLTSAVYQQIRQLMIIPDSIQMTEQLSGNYPKLRQYHQQLWEVDAARTFIDELLFASKNKSRVFGQLLNDFYQFAQKMDGLNAEFARLRASGNANLGSTEFLFLIKESLTIFEQILPILLPKQPEKVQAILGLTNVFLDAYGAVLEKDFDALVMNVFPAADSLIRMTYRQRMRQKKGSFAIATTGLKVKGPSQELQEELIVKQRKIKQIFRYGAFMAAAVASKDSEEIKKAIQSIALPVGSYSIKRRSRINISLNAYPGLTGGVERIRMEGQDAFAPNIGFTAPIGFGLNWGYQQKINLKKLAADPKYRRKVEQHQLYDKEQHFLNGHSGSIFFPIVDLGAVVLFRLDNQEEALPEDINFQQFFSPGVLYAHGFPKLPISIMAGAQLTPKLRKIGDQSANALRFNLSLVVDLPMANLYTKRR